MSQLSLRYWAAAREAAGCAEESYDSATLAEAIEVARLTRGERFAQVLARSSYLVDGNPVGARSHGEIQLDEGAVVEVLPPFAGG